MKRWITAALLLVSWHPSPAVSTAGDSSQSTLQTASIRAAAGRCEAAYHSGRTDILSQTLAAYDSTLQNAGTLSQRDRSEFRCLRYKFQSDLEYLNGDYSTAIKHIDSSIALSYLVSPETELNLQVEKAQSLFMLQDYQSASSCLAKVYYGFSDSLSAVYASAYALSLARCGRFSEARDIMSENCLPEPSRHLDSDTRLERERRKAKISVLEAETLTTSDPARAAELYNSASAIYRECAETHRSLVKARFAASSPLDREAWWMTHRQFIVDCYRLENAAPDLVYDIALFNKNLLLEFARGTYTDCRWQDVRRSLAKNAAAIEFVQYSKGGRPRLGAVVIRPGTEKPTFIPIAATEDIASFRLTSSVTVRKAMEQDLGSRKNLLYSSEALQNLIWNDSLQYALKGCRDVWFSADGIFHQLAIEYMYPGRTRMQFHRLSSTRALTRRTDASSSTHGAAMIFGGINFQSGNSPATPARNDTEAYKRLASTGFHFRNLDGSAAETQAVANARACPSDTVLTGSAATEAAFASLAGRYPTLHISTHGYFCGSLKVPEDDLKPASSDITLSQSVLLMSGAEYNLHAPGFSPEGRSDGILSAREISDSNLDGVRLCVLAACQTGLGEVTADGVYGIQRGFKNAGCGALILSLWSVSDAATSVFMTALHTHLSHGESIHDAFENARAELDSPHQITREEFSPAALSSRQTSVSCSFSEPCYKNAFILIDEI